MKDPGRCEKTKSGGDHEQNCSASDFSRRAFLRGSGAAAATTALTGQVATAVDEQSSGELAGPGAALITLSINGQKKQLQVEPRVTLLDALRNHLNITGAKKVCDRATCGACTVIVGELPAYACSVLAIDVQGKEIRTVESLGSSHPMIQSFVDNDAEQCGFCTPGFVMACTSFVENHPNPTLEDVEKGLGGNLCRCGTYVGIKAAVLQAAKTQKGGV